MLSTCKIRATHLRSLVSSHSQRPFPSLLLSAYQRHHSPIANTLHRTMASAVSKRLNGKTILITGASSGIGRSTAYEFARTSPQSLKLILTARRIDTLKTIAKDIQKEVGSGVQVHPVKLDVSSVSEVRGLIPSLPAEFQDIDILVNNAGLVKGFAQSPEIAAEDIEVMISTNVT